MVGMTKTDELFYWWTVTVTNEPHRPCVPDNCTPENLDERRRELLRILFGVK